MNKQEFAKMIMAVRSIWSKDDFLVNSDAASLWYAMLKDIPYEQISVAVQKHASLSKWPPTIADIREHVAGLARTETDWGSGWSQVLSAVRRYGYYNAEDALASMDEITQSVVKRLGWKQICMSEQDELTAVRANFRMIWEELEGKAAENERLPERIRMQIEDMHIQAIADRTEKLIGVGRSNE